MLKFDYNNDRKTFHLIRTNPKLSGNVKIVIDDNSLWLNAINVDDLLSNDVFQRYPIDMLLGYGENLSLFFNQLSINNDIVFKVSDTPNVKLQSYNYSDQFYTNYYYSSVNYTNSKFYDKKFAAFAPIYIDGDLPRYFVIFKSDGAISDRLDKINLDKSNYEIVRDVLYGSKILKTFDLHSSDIGKYLQEIVDNCDNNSVDLDVDFKNNTMTWNGYSAKYGVITGHTEHVGDLFSKDNTIIDFEKFVVDGYSKYGLIYPRILNIEYIFDDNDDMFDFNRYFGLYVDEIVMSKLLLDFNATANGLNNSNGLYDNYNRYDEIKNKIIVDNSIKIIDSGDFKLDDLISSSSKNFISFIKDKNNNLLSLTHHNEFDLNNEIINIDVDNEIKFDDLFGVNDKILEIDSKLLDTPGHSFIHIKLESNLSIGDSIIFYHPSGSQTDSMGRNYDVLESAEIAGYVDNSGDYYVYLDIYDIQTTPPITHNYYMFYGGGENNSMHKVAMAIANLINAIPSRMFEAYYFDNNIYIKSISSGDDKLLSISFTSVSGNTYNSIVIDDITGNDLIGNIINFRGGTKVSNRFLIDSDHRKYILENIEKIYIKTDNGLSRIKDVVKYIDGVGNSETFYNDFNNYVVCLVENDDIPIFDETNISIYREHESSVGLLSIRDIKDFDYDFISTIYNKIPYWEFYKFFSIPPDTHLLSAGIYYKVVGDGKIKYNDTIITSGNGNNSIFIGVAGVDFYEKMDGNPVVIYSDIDSDGDALIDVPLYDANGDINTFHGYFMLRSMANTIEYDNNDDYNYNKRFYEHVVSSEYDTYKENYNVNLSTLSRINPFINKWCYVDGRDGRGNPYRLNNSNVFGEYNVSSSHSRYKTDSNLLTHEYFYFVSNYPFINDSDIISNNYLYFDKEFDFDLYNGSREEFLNYFNYVPTYNNQQVGTVQKRYSVIKYYSDSDSHQTMFRGVKYLFDSDVNNYLFTIVLQAIKRDYNSYDDPIDVELIRNDIGKYIVLLITINLENRDNIDFSIDTINSSNYKSIYSSGGYKVEGDYRVDFDIDGVSDLTLLGIYSMSHAKFNNKLNRFSTINTPLSIRLNQIKQFNNSDYMIPVDDNNKLYNISLFVSSNRPVNYLKFMYGNSYRFLNYNELDVNKRSPVKGVKSNAIVIDKYPNENFVLSSTDDTIISTYPFTINPDKSSQIGGGYNYFGKLFDLISFSKMKDYINLGKIRDASGVNIKVISPDQITKNDVVSVKNYSHKPDGYKDVDVCSYEYDRSEVSTYKMHRYSGKYMPIFNNLVDFKYKFNYNNPHNVSNYDTIRGCGIELLNTFNSGVITNFGILKVSDNDILSLNKDKNGNSYPLIGESAIDYTNLNVFKSDWDGLLYHKYTDKVNYDMVYGSYNISDLNLFVNKKLMLPNEYNLYNYNIVEITGTSSDEMAYYRISEGIKMYFDLDEVITKCFMDDLFIQNISKYLPNDPAYLNGYDLNGYAIEYLKNNIVHLFDLDEVNIYYKYVTKSQQNTVNIVSNESMISTLLDSGYEIMKDININKGDVIEIDINENINYNYDIYILLKIKMI